MPCTWRHQGQEVTFLLQELCSSSWTANFSTTFLKIPLLEHLFCFCCSPDHWLWANPKINKATLTKRASETSSPLIQGSLLHREICPKPIRMEKYFPPMGAYVPAIHQSSWEVHLNTCLLGSSRVLSLDNQHMTTMQRRMERSESLVPIAWIWRSFATVLVQSN